MSIRKRGRPVGYKLSDDSKKAISDSKMGQHHSQQTKDKISKSLRTYFKNHYPLSDEIAKQYSSERYRWIASVKHELNNSEGIMTDRALRNSQRMEMACGDYIEAFKHELTPELIVMYKEHCLTCDDEDIMEEED